MEPFSLFLVYLILLNVGKSPADVQEFTRIRGEWAVVGMEAGGKQLPPELWRGKTLVIAPATNSKEQPAKSIAFWGRLNRQRSRPTLESRFVTVNHPEPPKEEEDTDPKVPAYPKIPPFVAGVHTHIIYDLQSTTMRMLITQIGSKEDKPPNKVETDANSRGALFVLKRKSTPGTLIPENPKKN